MISNKLIKVSTCHNTLTTIVHDNNGNEIMICKICGERCEEHIVPYEYLVMPKYRRFMICNINDNHDINKSKYNIINIHI